MDFNLLSTPENKERLAIVVVGYNRLKGITRLLNSINAAYYEELDVPLVISIDASGDEELYDYVYKFEWNHGTKYVNIQKDRLGLKAHIFQCGSLSKFFKGVIILEDDLFVSPFFYHYSKQAVDKYGCCEDIAGISLYATEINGYVGLPFQPVVNQFDVYAWQTVSSWGEIWNERMWNDFVSWLDKWIEDFASIDMVSQIKGWTRAWSKYFYAYLISKNKYFICPYQSLTTNFNDAGGEHGGGNSSVVQTSLIQGKKDYLLGDFKDLVKYDVYAQNMSLPQWLGIEPNDLTVDFYGLKEKYKGHYILSPFKLPYNIIKGFSLSMRPWELNIKYGIPGDDISLYKRENARETTAPKRAFDLAIARYYLRGFNPRLLVRYSKNLISGRIKQLLHI